MRKGRERRRDEGRERERIKEEDVCEEGCDVMPKGKDGRSEGR